MIVRIDRRLERKVCFRNGQKLLRTLYYVGAKGHTNPGLLTHVGQSGTGRRKVRQSQMVSKRSTQTQAGQYSTMSMPGDHQTSWKT